MNITRLGERIRTRRKRLGLTQSALCSGIVTRNMLSQIETGKASPSLPVLLELASRLEVDAGYLLSDADSGVLERQKLIQRLRDGLKRKSYSLCLNEAQQFGEVDEEIALIIAICSYELGKECVLLGQLKIGFEHLSRALEFSSRTVYPTSDIEAMSQLYLAIAKNIQSPLLELKLESFRDEYFSSYGIELLRYISGDFDYEYKNPLLLRHARAKNLIKAKRFSDALDILLDIADNKKAYGYNAFVIFSVYTDIEYVMRELQDFEGAYRYSSKRISMLQSFNS